MCEVFLSAEFRQLWATPDPAVMTLMSKFQESIDLKTFFRYKKASTFWKKPYIMGLSRGFEQGKPATALPELINSISTNIERVNP
jgi:hypothetical protein